MADQQPPTTDPQVRIETPIPISSGIVKAPNQQMAPPMGPQASGEHPLPDLRKMLPTLDPYPDVPLEAVKNSPYPISDTPNERSMQYVRGWNQNLFETMAATAFVGSTNLIGGAVSGLGYMLDFESQIKHWSGVQDDYNNWLSQAVEDFIPKAQDYIFEEEPGTTNLSDPAFWGSITADVAHSAGLMAPAVLITALSDGAINAFAGSSALLRALSSGIVGGLVQRMGESSMEAYQTSRQVYEDAIKVGYSEEQAKALMGKAGSATYNDNMKLALVDMIQMVTVFGGVKNLAGLRGNGFSRLLKNKYVTYPFSIGSEAAEEWVQQGISEKAYDDALRGTYLPEKSVFGKSLDIVGDPDTQRAMIAGALGGGIFQAVGPKLERLSQSAEYKAFEKQNKEEAKTMFDKLATPDELAKVQDDTFLDLVTRHANSRSLDKVQDMIDKMSNVPSSELEKAGINPDNFYRDIGQRQIEVAEIGKLYNDVYSRTKVDPVIKDRLFKSYATKFYINKELKGFRKEIDAIMSEEYQNGNTKLDSEAHVYDLIKSYLDKSEARTEIQTEALAQLKTEYAVSPNPTYQHLPIVKEAELEGKVKNMTSLIYENRMKDLEIIKLNDPAYQKKIISSYEKGQEIRKELEKTKKEEEKKAAESRKAGETQKAAKEQTAEIKKEVKGKKYSKNAINERMNALAQKLVDNDFDMAKLTPQERADYENAKERIHGIANGLKKTGTETPTPTPKKTGTPKKETETGEGEGEGTEEGSSKKTKRKPVVIPETATEQQRAVWDEISLNQEAIEKRPTSKGKFYKIAGENYARVSNVLPDFNQGQKPNEEKMNLATGVGTAVDTMARDFFTGNLKKRYPEISPEAYKSLLEFLKTTKKNLDKEGTVVRADNIVLYDPNTKIAGEVDLLFIYPDGTMGILDVKTSKKLSNFEYSIEKYTYQQSAYSNLLSNQYGNAAATLGLMPIIVYYRDDGYILSAEGKQTIEIDYEPNVNEYVPLTQDGEGGNPAEAPAGITAFAKSPLSDEMEFRDFAEFLKQYSDEELVDGVALSPLESPFKFGDSVQELLYNGKRISTKEAARIIRDNLVDYAQHFLDESGVNEALAWKSRNKKTPGRTWQEQIENRNQQFEKLALYPRVDRADGKMAIHSRDYKETYHPLTDGRVGVNRRDINNALREDMEAPELLSSKFFPVGTKLTIEVLDDPNTIMYSGRGDKTPTTWGAFRATLDPSDYHLYVPMAIKDAQGKLLTYVHNVNWVDESNISQATFSIDEAYERLATQRLQLYNNKVSEARITSRGPGAVFMIAPQKGNPYPMVPLSEGMPNAELGVIVGGRGTDREHIDEAIAELESNTNIFFREGEVIAYAPGEYPVVAYTHARYLNQTEVDSLMSALKAYIIGPDEFSKKVKEVMKIDLGTLKGFREYLQHFITVTEIKDQYKGKTSYNSELEHQLKDEYKKSGKYSGEDRFLSLSAGSNTVNFAEGGEVGYAFSTSRNVKNMKNKEIALTQAREFFAGMKINIKKELLTKTYPIVLSENEQPKVETRNYYQHAMEGLSSRVMGFNVGTEENPEYVYRINPVIQFEVLDSAIGEQADSVGKQLTPYDSNVKIKQANTNEFTSKKEVVDFIYSQLPDKTASNNVVLENVYQQAGIAYAKSINGIFSLRVNNSDKHFGNPFSSVPSEIAKGLIPTSSTEESVKRYIDWVLFSNEERAKWIRSLLDSGQLKDKPIVYYKELGQPSHANALDYLINNKIPKVSKKEVSKKENASQISDEDLKAINQIKRRGNKQSDARPLTKDEKIAMAKSSSSFLLIPGIAPQDLRKVVDNISSMLIKKTVDFEAKGLNVKATKAFFEEIKKTFENKQTYYNNKLANWKAQIKEYPSKARVYADGIEAFTEISESFDALLNNYDRLAKFVLHDLASVAGIDLQEFTDAQKLSEKSVEEMVEKVAEGFKDLDEEETGIGKAGVEAEEENSIEGNEEGGVADEESSLLSGEDSVESYNILAKLKKSAKQSMSVSMKLFIRSIVKNDYIVNEDGTVDVTPILDDIYGLPEVLDPDEVIDYLLPELTNNFFTFKEMVERMDQMSEKLPWVKTLVTSLKSASPNIHNDFFHVFDKVVINMKYIMTGAEGGKILVLDDNIGETTKLTERNWTSNFKGNSKLVTSSDGALYLNKSNNRQSPDVYEKWLAWAEQYNNVKEGQTPDPEEFREFLALFGIELHPVLFERIVTGEKKKGAKYATGLTYMAKGKQRTVTYAMQFNSSFGIVSNLTNKLRGLKTDSYNRITSEVSELYNSGVIKSLAREQAKLTPHLRSASFNSGTNIIASHVDPYYIAKRTFDLQKRGVEGFDALFNSKNFWVDKFRVNPALLQELSVSLLSLSPNREFDKVNFPRDFSKLDAQTREVVKLSLFTSSVRRKIHNPNDEYSFDELAGYFYPTLGDNQRNIVVIGPRGRFVIKNVNSKVDNDMTQNLVTREMVDAVYETVFMSEAARMAFSVTNPTSSFIRGKNIFYAIPELNTDVEGLFDEEHNIIASSDTAEIVSPEVAERVKEVIEAYLARAVYNKLDEWFDLGIGFEDEAGNVYQHLDTKYVEDIKDSITQEAESESKSKFIPSSRLVLKNIAADYVINNILALHSIAGLYIGDMATFYKQSEVNSGKSKTDPTYDFKKDIDATLQGINKRLGTEIGPAAQQYAEDTDLDEEPVKVLVVEDVKQPINEDLVKYYQKIGFTEDQIKLFAAPNKTDGIIFNHPLEHLNSLWRYRKISHTLYKTALSYYKKTGNLPAEVPVTTLKTRHLDQYNMNEHVVRVHIKGAEFYLSPEMIEGNPALQKIYDLMGGKNMKINKVAFSSTIKTGKNGTFQLYDKEGNINPKTNIEDSTLHITRGGLQLQTNTPNRSKQSTAKMSTQASKQIFLDVEDQFAEEITEFNKHFGNQVAKQKKAFLDDIGYDEATGELKIGKFAQKVVSHLRQYTKDLNVFSALQVVDTAESKERRKQIEEYLKKPKLDPQKREALEEELKELPQQLKSPLFAAPSRAMIEPYVMSLVSSIIDDIQFPGSTYTISTEMYISPDNKGITYTKAFDPEKGLQHYRYDGDTVQRSQVVISWPFPDLDMEDYIGEDGRIDTKLLPQRLLNLVATRIPVATQASIHALEIVGFLPYNYKGVVITHPQLIAQTGWDMDDDKLFFYYPEYEVLDEYGVVYGTKDEFGKSLTRDSEQKQIRLVGGSDINKMLKIMEKVLLSPDPQVRRILHEPVSAELLRKPYEVLYSKFTADTDVSYISEPYFAKSYESQANVSDMIGISANLLNLHSVIRQTHTNPIVRPASKKYSKLVVAHESSTREMGLYQDAKGNRISQNITAVLQASVDHANLGWLSVMNINQHTTSALSQALMEGFSVPVAFALINQNIVQQYIQVVDELRRNSDVGYGRFQIIEKMLEYFPNKKISDIINSKEFKNRTNEDKKNIILDLYDLSDGKSKLAMLSEEQFLHGSYGQINEETGKTEHPPFPNEDDINWQIFFTFLHLTDIGRVVSSYQTRVNVDSKGYGKQLYMADDKMETPIQLAFESNIDGLGNILGDYYKVKGTEKVGNPLDLLPKGLENRDEYEYLGYKKQDNKTVHVFLRPTTIYGIATLNGRDAMLKTLLNPDLKLYPYNSPAFQVMWKVMSETFLLDSRAGFEKAKIKGYAFNDALAYLNSSLATGIYSDGDVAKRRTDLMIGRAGHKTLANILDIAKKDPYLKENPFLKKLTSVHDANGNRSTIEYTSVQRDELAKNAVYSGFYDLLNLEGRLIEGTDMTTQEFVENLVEMAFLNGGLQNSRNFVKIIPADYLWFKGYYDFLYNIDLRDPAIFGIEPNGNAHHVGSFLLQLARHYPEFIRYHSRGKNVVTFKTGEKVNIEKAGTFKLPKEFQAASKRIPTFLNFLDKNGESQLFLYNPKDQIYEKLELLKDYPDTQYDAQVPDGYNRPIQHKLRGNRYYTAGKKELHDPEKGIRVPHKELDALYTKDKTIPEVLDAILNYSQDEGNKRIASFLKEAFVSRAVKATFIAKHPVMKGLERVKGQHIPPKGKGISKVEVDPQGHINNYDYEVTILHELLHAVAYNLVIHPKQHAKNIKDKRILENIQTLQDIYGIFRASLQERYGSLKAIDLDAALPVDQHALINAASTFTEFMAEALSNNVVKDYLNTGIWKPGPDNLLKRFWSAIINILKNIGIQWNERLADKIEGVMVNQQHLFVKERIEEYNEVKRLLEEEGPFAKYSFKLENQAADKRYALQQEFGLGLVSPPDPTMKSREVPKDEDGLYTIILDRQKLLDRLLSYLPESFDSPEYSQMMERISETANVRSKNKIITNINDIDSKHISFTKRSESLIGIKKIQEELMRKYDPGRVVQISEKEVALLKEGYIFVSPEDIEFEESISNARPIDVTNPLLSNGNTYSYIDENMATRERERLVKIYGEGRVSEVGKYGNEFLVEVYALEDARSFFDTAFKNPIRARNIERRNASKKAPSKQQTIAEHITDRIEGLENIRKKLEKEQIKNPDIETVKKINQLIDQINELDSQRKEFSKVIVKDEVIFDFVQRRLDVLAGLIADPESLLNEEVDKINQELNWIQEVGDSSLTLNHFIFGEKWKTNPLLREKLTGYGKEAGDLANSFHDEIIRRLVFELNKRRVEGQDEITRADIEEMIQDVDALTANTTTIFGASSHPLVELLGKLVNETAVEQSMMAKENYDKVDELIRKVLAIAPNKNHPFEIFFEKDKNGNPTNWLTHFFSYEYSQELKDVRAKSAGTTEASFKKSVLPWLKENANFIDPRKLFPTSKGDTYHYTGKTFSEAERAAYAESLKEEYGPYIYSKILEDAALKVKRFTDEYALEQDKINADEDYTEAQRQKYMQEYERLNSPYIAAESIVDGDKGFGSFRYVSQPPKRYKPGTTIPTGWVNERFFEIANTPAYLEFYEFAYDKLHEINTIDPEALNSVLGHRAINFMQKRFVETMMGTGNKVRSALAYGREAIIDQITSKDEPYENLRKVDKDGNTIYKANNRVMDDQREVTRLAENFKVDFKADMSKVENEDQLRAVLAKWNIPAEGIVAKYNDPKKVTRFNPQNGEKVENLMAQDSRYPEVYRAIRQKASEEYFKDASRDLGTILKYYTTLSNTYRTAYNIESLVNMTMQVFNQTRYVTTDGYENPVETGSKASMSNLKEMIDYQLRVTMGYERYARGKVKRERVYTEEEKKRIAEIDARLADEDLPEPIKESYRAMRDKIGRPVYSARLIDGLLHYTAVLGLGWRVIAGNSNLILGQATNLIEAGYGRFFKTDAILKATKNARFSILKNLTFNKIETKEARKVRAIVDRYGLVSDMTTEFYKSSAMSPKASWFRWLAPTQLTKRVEYLNQTPLIEAYLNSHKVSEYIKDYKGDETLFEALMEDGKWDAEKFGPITTQQLNAMIYEPIEQIKEIIMGPYNFSRTMLGKRTVGGRAIAIFHTWVPEAIRVRFQTERYDPFARVVRKGRYNTIGDLMRGRLEMVDEDFHTTLNNISFVFQNILKQSAYNTRFTDHDAANIKGFLRECAVLVTLITAKLILEAVGDLDDDNKRNDSKAFILYYLLNSSNRLIADLAVVPIFLTSPNSQKGFIPTISVASNLIKFLTSSAQVLTGNDQKSDDLVRSLSSFVPAVTEVPRIGRFLSEEQPVIRKF